MSCPAGHKDVDRPRPPGAMAGLEQTPQAPGRCPAQDTWVAALFFGHCMLGASRSVHLLCLHPIQPSGSSFMLPLLNSLIQHRFIKCQLCAKPSLSLENRVVTKEKKSPNKPLLPWRLRFKPTKARASHTFRVYSFLPLLSSIPPPLPCGLLNSVHY